MEFLCLTFFGREIRFHDLVEELIIFHLILLHREYYSVEISHLQIKRQ